MVRGAAGLWDKFWKKEREHEELYLPHHFLLNAIHNSVRVKGKKVLEVGGGRGADSFKLVSEGAWSTAIDRSWNSIRLISSRTASQGVKIRLVMADARYLPFKSGTFDLISHQGFLEHFRDPVPYLKQQIRLLKPSGYVVISVPQRYNIYTLKKRLFIALNKWPFGWEASFSLSGLRKLLKRCGLEVVNQLGSGFDGGFLDMIVRYFHWRGMKRFGKPVIPERIGNAIENFWKWIEKSRLGGRLLPPFRFAIMHRCSKEDNSPDRQWWYLPSS